MIKLLEARRCKCCNEKLSSEQYTRYHESMPTCLECHRELTCGIIPKVWRLNLIKDDDIVRPQNLIRLIQSQKTKTKRRLETKKRPATVGGRLGMQLA